MNLYKTGKNKNMKYIYFYSGIFALIIIFSNILVQYKINDWLTYGAIIYPITFLLTDVLGEKYGKVYSLSVIKRGILLSIFPTMYLSDPRIAIASIVTFVITQNLDIYIFHILKDKYPLFWWIRNNISTMTSQLFDTIIFFLLAFAFTMPLSNILMLIIGDYIIKFILALLDTPFFYMFAIKNFKGLKKNGI